MNEETREQTIHNISEILLPPEYDERMTMMGYVKKGETKSISVVNPKEYKLYKARLSKLIDVFDQAIQADHERLVGEIEKQKEIQYENETKRQWYEKEGKNKMADSIINLINNK